MKTIDEPSRILIVDDEAQITRVLRTALSTQGYSLKVAADGLEGLEIMENWEPDLVITDLAMPKINGIELCRAIREKLQVPILVLSVRNQDRQKIEALDSGADDYVTKPFSIQELLARVRALLRRQKASQESRPAIVDAGDFHIDQIQHRVLVRGEEVHLTPKEFDLMLCFAEHPNQVLTHRILLHTVWGAQVGQPEYLRVHINQLRKKIETSNEPRYIITEPWIGYRFRPTGDERS